MQNGNRKKPSCELELVIFCARPQSPENEERLLELLKQGVNWNEVLACASQHNLLLALCKSLLRLDPSPLQQEQLETLRGIEREEGKSNLAIFGEMVQLLRLFEAAGIPAIPHEGPVLALMAYNSFTLRTFADLNFVIAQREIPAAVALLRATGYRAQFEPVEAEAGRWGRVPGQYSFVSDYSRILVELHTERTLRYFPRTIDLEKLNGRMIEIDIGGQKVRTFSVEDTLVMLSVHGAKHFWERLSWIVDLANLSASQPVNWSNTIKIAAEMKCLRLLLSGLYLAHELFGAELPQSLLDNAENDSNVLWLSRKVSEKYKGISDSSAGVIPRFAFRLRSRDGIGQGLRHVLRLAISPTESDREIVSLPTALSPLYVFLRPWRLMREYGLGVRRPKTDLARYEPTPVEIVDRMIEFANIEHGDVLYDLGCGDGRIVVAAAEKFGIRAVGVDIDPKRIAEAKANAQRHGVEGRVKFLLKDAKSVDVSEATIVTLYLPTMGVLRLVEHLRSQLKPGARIVSRNSMIYGWPPDRSEKHILSSGIESPLYLWTITKSRENTS